MTQDPIVNKVIQKLKVRSDIGVSKYKTNLHANRTDNFLIHLQEELLDAANYVEKLLEPPILSDAERFFLELPRGILVDSQIYTLVITKEKENICVSYNSTINSKSAISTKALTLDSACLIMLQRLDYGVKTKALTFIHDL